VGKELKELLKPKDWHHIYKDECNGKFLILRGMEVSIYSDIKLRVLFYNSWQFKKYKKICRFEDPWPLGDGVVDCYTDINNLQKIVDGAGFKRRPHRKGEFLKKLEFLLGHKIFYFNPQKDNNGVNEILKKARSQRLKRGKFERKRQKGIKVPYLNLT